MNVRLIEQAFPLKQASLDSVHEKNVRHGHISTLYIWPARRLQLEDILFVAPYNMQVRKLSRAFES
jgi:hypothetical protein